MPTAHFGGHCSGAMYVIHSNCLIETSFTTIVRIKSFVATAHLMLFVFYLVVFHRFHSSMPVTIQGAMERSFYSHIYLSCFFGFFDQSINRIVAH